MFLHVSVVLCMPQPDYRSQKITVISMFPFCLVWNRVTCLPLHMVGYLSHKLLGILLSPLWHNCRNGGITHANAHNHDSFYVGPSDLTQIITLVWQAVYPLSSLSSPKKQIYYKDELTWNDGVWKVPQSIRSASVKRNPRKSEDQRPEKGWGKETTV